jgi:hypothetical protein
MSLIFVDAYEENWSFLKDTPDTCQIRLQCVLKPYTILFKTPLNLCKSQWRSTPDSTDLRASGYVPRLVDDIQTKFEFFITLQEFDWVYNGGVKPCDDVIDKCDDVSDNCNYKILDKKSMCEPCAIVPTYNTSVQISSIFMIALSAGIGILLGKKKNFTCKTA